MQTEESIREALKQVAYPGYSRDIISFGLVKSVACNQGAVSLGLELTANNPEVAAQLKVACEQTLKALPEVTMVHVDVKMPAAGQGRQVWGNQKQVPGIKKVVAVASGKGGVGKSTMSCNLAVSLRHLGFNVGLLDCDIYGPSIPLMMGVSDKPSVSPQEKLVPLESHGIKLMSMGFLLDDDQPVIWRGPMIQKTIQQFLTQVDWGELDVLLIDLPPGTGDAQLSLCQTVPLDGGVVITTPQEASVGVVRKGIAMFEKLNVPILGIVENMSYFVAPGGERVEIFGHGGGKAEAERKNVAFLGEVPIYTEIRMGGDRGIPVVASEPDSKPGKTIIKVAEELKKQLYL